jgi:hypothetical protein
VRRASHHHDAGTVDVGRRYALGPFYVPFYVFRFLALTMPSTAAEEGTSADVTPRPESLEDEAAARRHAIAERMAHLGLGGIQFGAPPLMDIEKKRRR